MTTLGLMLPPERFITTLSLFLSVGIVYPKPYKKFSWSSVKLKAFAERILTRHFLKTVSLLVSTSWLCLRLRSRTIDKSSLSSNETYKFHNKHILQAWWIICSCFIFSTQNGHVLPDRCAFFSNSLSALEIMSSWNKFESFPPACCCIIKFNLPQRSLESAGKKIALGRV